MYEPWRVQLFGALRAVRGDRIVTRFRSQQTGALLGYLAYHRHTSHSREKLIDLFWPESELETGRHNLSNALSSLRGQLEPPGVASGSVIVADRFSVELNAEAVTTDVAAFEQALSRAAKARTSPGYPHSLMEAVDRYGGPLLPHHYDSWIAPEQERLHQRFRQASGQLIGLMEADAELGRAIEVARRCLSFDPLREEAHRDVMRLLAASGLPEDALQQFHELERLYADELGAAPSKETLLLARQIETKFRSSVDREDHHPNRRPAANPSGLTSPSPSGTVTFLLVDSADVISPTANSRDASRANLAMQDALLSGEFRRSGGHLVSATDLSYFLAFAGAVDAVDCALACRRVLDAQAWTEPGGCPSVRMALHTGDLESDGQEYQSQVLDRAVLMLSAGHAGQILVSETTAPLVKQSLNPRCDLKDLGPWRLSDGDAVERIYQLELRSTSAPEFPPLNAVPAYKTHLPAQFTRFFGRADEIEQIIELLKSPAARLVTLSGPGGSGKTRLVIEAAARIAESFRGDIWFVPLADIADAGAIPRAIVDGLGLPGAATIEPLSQAVSALERSGSLLILDNFEHLVEGGAEIVQTLLHRVPSLRCLTTSRQLLGLAGEQELVVPALPIPNGADTPERLSMFESVQLYVDRARGSKPDFRITNSNAAAVAEICDRLEGLPLAIELAAARALVMTPAQILAQLTRRFEFLVSRRRGVPERQRTLLAAVDWSYRLLSPDLQRLLRRLSVFRGGWTVEFAESVCEEPLALDSLAQLLDCSLIQSRETEQGIRFGMLETLREFGDSKLEEMERFSLARRHVESFLALAEESEQHLWGEAQLAWHDRLDAEYENLETALRWAETNDPIAGLRLFGALAVFVFDRAHGFVSWERVEQMLARCPDSSAVRAKALRAAGLLADDWQSQGELYEGSLAIYRRLGRPHDVADLLLCLGTQFGEQMRYGLAEPYLDQALALYRQFEDERGVARVLRRQGHTMQAMGRPKDALPLQTRALELLRKSGDLWGVANTLHDIGYLAKQRCDYAEARHRYEEALQISRRLRHPRWLPPTLANYAASLVDVEEYDAADRVFEETLAVCRDTNDINWRAQTLELYGFAACRQGKFGLAGPRFAEAIRIRTERDPGSYPVVRLILGFAWLAAETGRSDRAMVLLSVHDQMQGATGLDRPPFRQADFDRIRQRCEAGLDAAKLASCWEEGGAMSVEEAVAYALELGR